VVARKKETRRALAFPEGKVDFLQLVAEKTKEGLPRTGRAGSLMQRELSKIFDF